MAHAPVDAVCMETDREDGRLVVKGLHLLWEEPPDGVEQQAAHPEGVSPLATLHHGSDLPRLVPLHKHPAEHGETTQLAVIGVAHRHRVKGRTRGGGGGVAG